MEYLPMENNLKLIHGSLFSGQGGFDLASEWMGWENAFHCEWNPFGQRILKHYWPNSESYADIKQTDFSIWRGRIDILTGGFPCQPYSNAGLRKGKEDERHLWPEMLRAIREIKPCWVVGENVFGLVNWNGGMVFDEVQADLEAEGYEVFAYVLPACAVNAPHRRDRIWFVAHSNECSTRSSGKGSGNAGQGGDFIFKSSEWGEPTKFDNGCSDVLQTYSNSSDPGNKSLQKQTFSAYISWASTYSQSLGGGERGGKKTDNSGWGSSKYRRERNQIWNRCSSISRTRFFTYSQSERGQYDGFEQCEISKQKKRKFGGTCGKLVSKWNDSNSHSKFREKFNITIITNEQNGSIIGKNDFSESNSNSDGIRLRGENDRIGKAKFFGENGQRGDWANFPTQSPVCSGNDGVSSRLVPITVPGRKQRRTLTPKQAYGRIKKETIKAGGNAIVPQVVYQIYKAIEEYIIKANKIN